MFFTSWCSSDVDNWWFFSHHDVALMLGIFIVSLCFSYHEASLMMGMFCCAPGPALLCFSNSFYVQIHSKSSAYPFQRNQSCFYVPEFIQACFFMVLNWLQKLRNLDFKCCLAHIRLEYLLCESNNELLVCIENLIVLML